MFHIKYVVLLQFELIKVARNTVFHISVDVLLVVPSIFHHLNFDGSIPSLFIR